MAQVEQFGSPAAAAAAAGDEGRVYSVKTVAAELPEARSIVEGLSAHLQGAERRDRGRRYAVVAVLRDRRWDLEPASFQALAMIEFVVLGPEAPWLLLGWTEPGWGSDW